MATLIDSYSESNYFFSYLAYSGASGAYTGQSFSNVSEITLDSCQFYINKVGSPTGTLVAYVYAHTGTYGSSSAPTGSPIATSDTYDISTLGTSIALTTLNFSGANRITLSASTYYCLVVSYTGGNSSNYLAVGYDATSPTHGGNRVRSVNGITWFASASADVIFYVYGASAHIPVTTTLTCEVGTLTITAQSVTTTTPEIFSGTSAITKLFEGTSTITVTFADNSIITVTYSATSLVLT